MPLGSAADPTPFPEKCRRIWNRISRHPRLSAAVLSLLLLVIVFPDVIFHGASFVINDQLAADLAGKHGRWIYPLPHHGWWASYSDDGGTLWQSEPMMEFIRYCLRTLNSPYWNPFSGAGALGPETLVDMKFSAFTLAYALLGGGSLVYNLLMLFMYGFACYCLIRIIRDELGLSGLAAFAAGGFYLLNGYAAANIAANFFISYLFIPPCLYASFFCAKAPSVRRWAIMALSFVPLLSCSFLPTTIMAAGVIFALTIGYTLSIANRPVWRAPAKLLAIQVLAMIAAVGVLAVLYLPFVESLSQSGMLDLYQKRLFYRVFLTGVFSLFTPSHFFESYNAMEQTASQFSTNVGGQQYYLVTGNTVFHFGFVGLSLAACALREIRTNRWRWFIITCFATLGIVLSRIFAVPGIMQIIDHLPVIGNLGCQYLWVAVSIPLVFLVAFGAENVRKNKPSRGAVAGLLLIALAGAIYVGIFYGLRQPHIHRKIVFLCMDASFAALVIIALWTGWLSKIRGWKSISFLVILMFAELTIDAKQLRMPAMSIFASPPSWVTYLRQHIGDERTMTIGDIGLAGEAGSAYQIPEITSINGGTLSAYKTYFDRAVKLDPAQYWLEFASTDHVLDTPDKNSFDWPKLNLMGVKYVLLPSGFTNYQAAFLAHGLHPAASFGSIQILENPYALPHVFTVEMPQSSAASLDLPNSFRDHLKPARILNYRNASVEVQGTAPAPSFLVLSDIWHPNWRATVNGKLAPIVKVDGTFRGVWVPAGSFDVQMTYRPKTLAVALIISILSFIGLIGVLLSGRRRDVKTSTAL